MDYINTIIRIYDEAYYSNQWHQRIFGDSGYSNFGYWFPTTRRYVEACDNLVDKLVEFIPHKKGSILDVACGGGGTTRRLLDYYTAENITAINISEKQLAQAKYNAQGCRFVLMDAAFPGFKDASFENIICVEAAFHFHSRERFIDEAYRMLQPGGRLVMSDILTSGIGRMVIKHSPFYPAENNIAMEEYRELFFSAGFKEVTIVDATNESWRRFFQTLVFTSRAESEFFNKITIGHRVFFLLHLLRLEILFKKYILVSAYKA